MIDVIELSKDYGRTRAVSDLTFSVRPGAVTGFLGPNGAGKSTTLRMVLGLDRPTAGRALVDGIPYRNHPAPLHAVGALLDAGEVHPRRTAYAHLLALAATMGAGRRRVDEVLDLVGLSAVARQRVGGYSLGMRQRLGIAGALLGDPGVVILDEPVNGLDPEGVLWVRRLLRALADEGRTVFVSSHLMSEMSVTADHLVVIGRGRLVADVPTAELLGSVAPSLLVQSPRATDLAAALTAAGARVAPQGDGLEVSGVDAALVARTALDRRIEVHELRPHTRSLEDAFLELTGGAVEFRGTGTHEEVAA